MAVDYFLKIGSIEGESISKGHDKEIDVLSFHWGVSNRGTSGFSGGQGSGKCDFQDLTVTKLVDKSSPLLMQACATGQHFPKAVLSARRAGGDQQDYLQITMTGMMISSFQQSGASQGDLPTDSFSLNFSKIEFDYWPQKADGTLGAKVHGGWDLAKNVKA